MKLGLGSYAFAWAIGVPGHPPRQPMDVFAFLVEAGRLGLGVVQIGDNLPLAALDDAKLDQVHAQAVAAGVAIEVGMRGSKHDDLLKHLRLAVRLGSPLLRVVTDSPGDEPEPDEVVRRLVSVLPEFRRSGVRIAIENHDRFTARTLTSIVERVGADDCGVCLDTVNSFGALEGPDVVVRTLAPHTLSLHLKDFRVSRVPSNMGFSISGAPAGEGQLDVPWLLDQLQSVGRDVNAILENWPPFGPDLDATIAREREWVDAGVARLREEIPD